MTTLYKPVLIESAEQAEALPEGTIIIHAENYPQEKFAGLWGREGNSSASLAEEEGWSALVPIEAEEEFSDKVVSAVANELRYRVLPDTLEGVVREVLSARRLVTPREPA